MTDDKTRKKILNVMVANGVSITNESELDFFIQDLFVALAQEPKETELDHLKAMVKEDIPEGRRMVSATFALNACRSAIKDFALQTSTPPLDYIEKKDWPIAKEAHSLRQQKAINRILGGSSEEQTTA